MTDKLTCGAVQETKVICDRCRREVDPILTLRFLDQPDMQFKGFVVCFHCVRKVLLGEL
jgi:hypothetical protein